MRQAKETSGLCPSSEADDSGHGGLVKDDELNVQLVLIIAG